MKSIAAELRRREEAAREEIKFVEAMERYCKEHRRRFPTWSEVLEVVRSLGYAPKKTGRASEANGNWEQLCAELKEERDRLQLALLELREEFVQVRRALIHQLTKDEEPEEVDFDALRAETGQGPSLAEFVADLEAELKAKGAL
jgi:hypothetical protein